MAIATKFTVSDGIVNKEYKWSFSDL